VLESESSAGDDLIPIQIKAQQAVVDYFNARSDKSDAYVLRLADVYVVWFCKTLQNWKALISTNVPDNMYYEVTYDGDKKIIYLDAYRKFDNVSIPDGTLLVQNQS
jgi:Family of unknown function (DUF6275)